MRFGRVLLCLAAAKLLLGVLTSPMLGYGNNYDFIRQASCIGLWPVHDGRAVADAHPDTPVTTLAYTGQRRPDMCMRSVDNVFGWLAAAQAVPGEWLDMRQVSVWKVLAVAAGAALLLVMLPAGGARACFALALFLVFGDLSNLLYLNTLYLEFSVLLWGLLAAFAVAACLAGPTRPRRGLLMLGLAFTACLGLSKQQYMPLAMLLAGLLALRCAAGAAPRRALAAAALAALLPLAYGAMNPARSGHMSTINLANKTDTLLGAVLPAAQDVPAALALLGLPASCGAGVGRSWYSPGVAAAHPCPWVAQVSRWRLLPLFATQPHTLVQPLATAAAGLAPHHPSYLGHVESPGQARTVLYQGLRLSSLSTLLALLPPWGAPVLCLLSALGAAWGLVAARAAGRDQGGDAAPACEAWLVFVGGLTALYALASSVFGDGYIELQKHAVGFLPGLSLQLSGLLPRGARWLARAGTGLRAGASRPPPWRAARAR